MPKSIEPADRRPLVYGIFALVILIAASYLFWPRSPQPESLVLTPESVRNDPAAADMETEPSAEEATDLETVDVGSGGEIAEETSISDVPPPTPKPKTSQPAKNTTAELTGNGPSSSGDWVLNVGAYSKESGARSRAAEISRQGMSAHVHRITSNGKTLWRVRVGYFASKAKATEYGQWMKSTHGIEGWASNR
jgi:cell division protein FtsN